MRHDVLIVGAGPAGSSAAQLLAKAGWSVALVEKAEFPRRKVCGEFISATTMPLLKALGIDLSFIAAAGPPVTQVGIYAGRAMLKGACEQIWGRALGREHLDVMLRDQALAAGARLFQPAQVTALNRECDGFCCTLDDQAEIHARIVIVACGSWNAKGMFSLPRTSPRSSDLFAFKAHFSHGRLPPGLMPLLAFPGGYGGLVQSDGARTSLSCCIRRDMLSHVRAHHGGNAGSAVLAHLLETTKGARLALEHATIEGGFLSTGPIRPGLRSRYGDGVYYTGNIAGEAHPVIAEGISMAIQSSGLLTELLIAHRGECYASEWKKRFGLRIRAASLFGQLAMRSPTRSASLVVLKAVPSLLGLGVRLSGKNPISA